VLYTYSPIIDEKGHQRWQLTTALCMETFGRHKNNEQLSFWVALYMTKTIQLMDIKQFPIRYGKTIHNRPSMSKIV
jgi:hypothetical protein